MALATQLFRVNVNTLRKSFVWKFSSQLFPSGLGYINQTFMLQIMVALHPLRFDGHHVSPSGVGLKVGAKIVMVQTNLVNGPNDTWKLFRTVVVINNHVSGQLTFSDLIKLKHHILVCVSPVKECKVDAFCMHFRQFQPSVALVE